MNHLVIVGLVCLSVLLCGVECKDKEVPPVYTLTSLCTETGKTLLLGADYKTAYLETVLQLVTQIYPNYSGVASAVTALNSLSIPAPPFSEDVTYSLYTQENIFLTYASNYNVSDNWKKNGGTIKDLQSLLTDNQHGYLSSTKQFNMTSFLSPNTTLIQLQENMEKYLQTENSRVIVNFNKSLLFNGTSSAGPKDFAMIVAYNSMSGHLLLLDPSRYSITCSSYWVETSALYDLMKTNSQLGYLVLESIVKPDSGKGKKHSQVGQIIAISVFASIYALVTIIAIILILYASVVVFRRRRSTVM